MNYWKMLWGWKTGLRLASRDLGELFEQGCLGTLLQSLATGSQDELNLFMLEASVQFSHSVVSDFVTPWTAAHQASLSITNSRSLPKLMSIELVMPSNYLILCHPLLLLPSISPSSRVFSTSGCWRPHPI